MDELPLLSIICTSYNHEDYIGQALESFVMQKTKFPFEIIVHDDASTDSTANIVRDYEAKYPALFANIYQTENQYSKGAGDVAKIIFSSAKGKYIALCEGDDYWTDPFKLQKQVDFMEVNAELSFCFHNAVTYFVDRDVYEDFNHNIKSGRYKTSDLLIKGWFIPSASVVIRREMLPDPFPDWYFKVFSGDYALELLLSLKGNFFYINEKMSVYRKNVTNSMSINGPQGTESLKKQIFLLRNFKSTSAGKNILPANYAILRANFKYFRGYFYKRFPFIAAVKDMVLH